MAENVCTPESVPSICTIHRGITKCLEMMRKRLSSVAFESLTERNQEWTLNFINAVSNNRVEQLHWFDELPVIRTTENRVYGHAE